MNEHIKTAIWLIGLGVALVGYVHANFAEKTTVEKMDQRIYDIWKEVVKK